VPGETERRECNHAKQELQRRRNLRTTAPGSDVLLEIQNHTPVIFAAPISSVDSNHHNKNSNCLQEKNTHQDTNQISGQSVQAKNLNTDAMDDVFLAFTMCSRL
jgi:hypothetical protein